MEVPEVLLLLVSCAVNIDYGASNSHLREHRGPFIYDGMTETSSNTTETSDNTVAHALSSRASN